MEAKSITFKSHLFGLLMIFLLISALMGLTDNSFDLQEDGTSISEEARIAVTDSQGSIIVVGTTHSPTLKATIGPQRMGKTDIFLYKLTPALELEWLRFVGGSGNDFVTAMDVDNNDNIILVGSTHSSNFQDETYNLNGTSDLFITKLSTAGEYLWTKFYGDQGAYYDPTVNYENINNMKIGLDNSIYLVGSTFAPSLFEPREIEYNALIPFEMFLVKLDSNGNYLWGNYQFGGWNDVVTSVLVDNFNVVTVSCVDTLHQNQLSDPMAEDYVYDVQKSIEIKDIVVSRYTSFGLLIDEAIFSGSGYDCATDVVLKNHNFYLSGYTRSDNLLGTEYIQEGESDLFVIKLSSDFELVWFQILGGSSYDGPNREQGRVLIEVTAQENVIVASPTYSTDIVSSTVNQGLWDTIIMNLSPDGEVLSQTYTGGTRVDYVEDMLVIGTRLILLGYTYSDLNFVKFKSQEGYRDAFLLDMDLTSNSITGYIL